MARGRQVACRTVRNPHNKFGQFANAFRVVEDDGTDCVLDFLVHSASDQQADVVSRIRVRREMLPAIRDRLDDAIEPRLGSESVVS